MAPFWGILAPFLVRTNAKETDHFGHFWVLFWVLRWILWALMTIYAQISKETNQSRADLKETDRSEHFLKTLDLRAAQFWWYLGRLKPLSERSISTSMTASLPRSSWYVCHADSSDRFGVMAELVTENHSIGLLFEHVPRRGPIQGRRWLAVL